MLQLPICIFEIFYTIKLTFYIIKITILYYQNYHFISFKITISYDENYSFILLNITISYYEIINQLPINKLYSFERKILDLLVFARTCMSARMRKSYVLFKINISYDENYRLHYENYHLHYENYS